LDSPRVEGVLASGTILQQRYKIIETRNVGGMSIVYRAQDLRFEKAVRMCAVKEMYNTVPDPLLREITSRSFDREANVLASLRHPAIPSIFDYFSERDRMYLVMEFIEGKDVDEIIEESAEPLPQDQVVDWAIQICDVLSYLHNHKPEPYVFRDLKPSNIMVDEHRRLMVIDFGIVKVFERGQRGTMIGTAGYPPPEQYRGFPEPRSDIYALGATMHHLLTRRDPRLETPFSFHEHSIRSLNPGVAEALDGIVMKALEYDIDKRFPTTEAFKQALQALVGPALSIGQSETAPPAVAFPTSTVSAIHIGTVVPVWEFTCEGHIGSTPTVVDGAVYVGCFDHNLYAIDARDGEFMWKFAADDAITSSPCVWRDRVLVGSHDRVMYAVWTANGKIAWSAPTRDCVSSSPRVAMDHVFFGSDDHFLYNVAAQNGRLVWRFEAEDHIRSSPALSEELVYVGSDDTNVYAIDIQTGREKWRFPTRRPVISSPLLYKDLLFFGSWDSTFYAIDAKAGRPVWNFRTRHAILSNPAVSESLGLVYFSSVDHCVYAFDYGRGDRPVWTFEMDGPGNTSSPAVSDEAVYIGSRDGHLYSLDARTGELRWKFYTGASVPSSPTIWENLVFVGSRSHKLYALPL